jgi:hypothetical protein
MSAVQSTRDDLAQQPDELSGIVLEQADACSRAW